MPRHRLDAEQFVPGIDPQMFVRLFDLTEEFGVAPQRLCAGLGCTVEDLHRGEQISNRQAWRMIRRALRLTGRADLGLELGSRENFSHFGLPGFAMSAARTMNEAVEIGMRYQNQTGALSSTTLLEANEIRFLTHAPDDRAEQGRIRTLFNERVAAINRQAQRRARVARIEIRFSLGSSFPYVHDRFAIIDNELWHFGATVGGLHGLVNAATRGWDAEAHEAVRFFNDAWNGDGDAQRAGRHG